MMPTEICMEMRAEKNLTLPYFSGYVSRGLLLHIIRAVNPSLASEMHEANVPKPYSVTPFIFRKAGKNEKGYVVDASQPIKTCFRFLRDEPAEAFLNYFQSSNTVTIYDTTLTVTTLHVKNEGYDELWNNITNPAETIKLTFLTPTYLSTQGTNYHHMFPDHTRIFTHLARSWNNFSNHNQLTKEECTEYERWLLKNIGVSQHKIKTTIAYMGEKKATGFTGWVIYELADTSKWNTITQILAKFAEYANIGGNRTGGFGVTKTTIKTK
ncbi:MAG: CRISPR-associated endoribonuclease Cas6 [Candidatus Freyarchaeota archaeon]|nr:CRISPR-associated endoribonuclease Cas6 [Candidatus Jordarchaeia archaeon]